MLIVVAFLAILIKESEGVVSSCIKSTSSKAACNNPNDNSCYVQLTYDDASLKMKEVDGGCSWENGTETCTFVENAASVFCRCSSNDCNDINAFHDIPLNVFYDTNPHRRPTTTTTTTTTTTQKIVTTTTSTKWAWKPIDYVYIGVIVVAFIIIVGGIVFCVVKRKRNATKKSAEASNGKPGQIIVPPSNAAPNDNETDMKSSAPPTFVTTMEEGFGLPRAQA